MNTNPRAYERRNNPIYADPRGHRIATMAEAIDSYRSALHRLYGALAAAGLAIFILSIFAVPTVINLLTR